MEIKELRDFIIKRIESGIVVFNDGNYYQFEIPENPRISVGITYRSTDIYECHREYAFRVYVDNFDGEAYEHSDYAPNGVICEMDVDATINPEDYDGSYYAFVELQRLINNPLDIY